MAPLFNQYMQNRELSWLQFNLRVLEEAEDPETPPMERLRFLSIFTNNLDEFFMVRVGSLWDLASLKTPVVDNKSGLTAKEQLELIYQDMPAIYQRKNEIYAQVMETLSAYGVRSCHYEDLNHAQLKYVKNYYREQLEPTIISQIIDPGHPLPFFDNKKLYAFVALRKSDAKEVKYGIVPISSRYAKYVSLPGDNFDYIRTEKIIMHHLDDLFSGYDIMEKGLVCVTRNFEIDTTLELSEEVDDYRDYMEKVIRKRQRQEAVRLEYAGDLTKTSLNYLKEALGLFDEAMMESLAPMNMTYVSELDDILPTALIVKLSYPEFRPFRLPDTSMFDQIEQRDRLLSYPYDSMDDFLRLLNEAAQRPGVQAIRITIYRLAGASKVVEALCKAAENGVEVMVMMELKARFDEQRNINYADVLLNSGCRVIYGFEELKCHAKLCLITYEGKDKRLRDIVQVGTGNYNEKTARQYTDFSLLTSDPEIAMDARDFFKHMAMGKVDNKYLHLLQAPTTLKPHFIKLIDREIEKGTEGYIMMKMNSLTDKDIITKLREASQHGVTVHLIIRGICCIMPEVKGFTERVEVRSIVGRYLEHPRVYVFGKEDPDIYLSSADMMTRNTEKRVELAVPIYDKRIQTGVLHYLDMQWQDDTKARRLHADGLYHKLPRTAGLNSQQYFMQHRFLEEAVRQELPWWKRLWSH